MKKLNFRAILSDSGIIKSKDDDISDHTIYVGISSSNNKWNKAAITFAQVQEKTFIERQKIDYTPPIELSVKRVKGSQKSTNEWNILALRLAEQKDNSD